jgi:arylsulfatase
VYQAGVGSIPESMAPNLRNRPWSMAASISVPADGPCDGIVVCHGGSSGGYALHLADRRLHYVNNLLGADITTITAEVELPAGAVVVRATFVPTGRLQGDLELWYGDVPVGRGHIAATTPLTYGVEPFSVGEQRMTPIVSGLVGRAALPAGVLDSVVIEAVGPPHRDPEGEQRAALAIQ